MMMDTHFDHQEAKKFLHEREERKKDKREEERKQCLDRVTSILKEEFKGLGVDVFLVGSITRPYAFDAHSDIDIVLKNFKGDRFELWTKLEGRIERNVEIILFEACSFQEFVLTQGFKVV